MSHAEFEEREFETALYQQLRVGNNHVWSPGQVLENSVGFDYSAFCVDSYFWAIHGLKTPYDGIFLEEYFHHRMHSRRINRPLPDFSLNLFIQAKRPDVRKTLPKALKGQPLSKPYWRINLDEEQQQVLNALSVETTGKCLVCYATPAFDRLSQLYSHTVAGTIVENSSFPEARWLSGHTGWNYDCPGAVGIANANPEYIERLSLANRINDLISEYSQYPSSAIQDRLDTLAGNVISSTKRDTGVSATAREALFSQKLEEINLALDSYPVSQYKKMIRSYLTVLAFSDTYKLRWFVLGRAT